MAFQLPKNPNILFLFSTFVLFIQFLFYSHSEGSETIILHPVNFSKIKIKFDFANGQDRFFNFEHLKHPTPIKKDKQFDPVIVQSLVRTKLEKLKEYLIDEKNRDINETTSTASTNEIVLIDSLTFPINLPEYKLNVSINTLQISGINDYTISDIAANHKSNKISALLRIPNVRISMFYKVNGISFQPKKTATYIDKGKITYTIHGWRTVFAGKVIDIKNNSRLEISGFGMRSHYNFYDSNTASFNYGQEPSGLIDIGKIISSTIMKKVINEIDDKFENIILDHLDVHEVGTWLNTKEKGDYFQKEEDGQLLMMESKVHESSRRRNKRQVPCEIGEELDEYVDSLFRFLKRLIRVMEPFNLPNVTVELEEYNLQIFLHSGMASRAYTFERKKPAWVLCQNDTISLGLTIGVDDARVNYRYRVIQDWRLLFDGDLEAQIRRPKAQIQITQLSPPEEEEEEVDFDAEPTDSDDEEEEPQVQQRIDKIKVWRPGQIVVLIRGLGNFSQALSMLINQMLSDTSMLDPIINMIETDGVDAANEMLRNVSIPIFSII